jgi:hypothetical protein
MRCSACGSSEVIVLQRRRVLVCGACEAWESIEDNARTGVLLIPRHSGTRYVGVHKDGVYAHAHVVFSCTATVCACFAPSSAVCAPYVYVSVFLLH